MVFRALLLSCFVIFSASALIAGVQQVAMVGTWKWVSVDGKAVMRPFYMQLSMDGRAATWPAPKDWPNTSNRVSKGNWSLQEGYFVIIREKGQDNPKAKVQIEDDEMTETTDDNIHLIYRRILPDLEPGKLDPATARIATRVKQSDLVGTWKLIRSNGQAPEATGYIRLFTNGKAVGWDSPQQTSSVSSESTQAKWDFKGGYLSYTSDDGSDSFDAWVTMSGDQLSLFTDDSNDTTWVHVVPDLEPGNVPSK